MRYIPNTSCKIEFRTLDEYIKEPAWYAESYEAGFLKVKPNIKEDIWELGSFVNDLSQEQLEILSSTLMNFWSERRGILSYGILDVRQLPTYIRQRGGNGYIAYDKFVIDASAYRLTINGSGRARMDGYALGYTLEEQRSLNVQRAEEAAKVNAFYSYDKDGYVEKLNLKQLEEVGNFDFQIIPVANNEIIEQIAADFDSVTMVSRESLGLHIFKVGAFARKPRFVKNDILEAEDTIGTLYALPTSELPSQLTLDKYEFEFSDSQLDEREMTQADIIEHPGLHDDQLRALNAHLSTEFGFVNAMATGEGKTISTLVAANYRSDGVEGYKMLVVVEAAVRDQWRKEAEDWLNDDFDIVTLNSRKDTEILRDGLNAIQPTLILCSYSLLSRVEDPQSEFDRLLANATFNDMVLDEGRTVRGSNKTARSLWHMRRNSDIGVVLCATPVLKNVQDMSALMAWARNTPEIKNNTVKEFFSKMSTKKEFERWYQWWGKALVRSSGSSAKLANMDPPSIETKVLMVTPGPQELEVSKSISGRIRESMVNIIETYKTMGNALDTEQERQLRGQILATSSVSRQASSDPRMLTDSQTAIAQLLQTDGTLNFPDGFIPAKLEKTVELCNEMTTGDEAGPVVIFTEFKFTANSLQDALEAEGITAKQFIGGMARKTRDQNLQEFNDGKAQVLIATSAAERGLNLQVARHMIHFDHKFTPDSIFQRTGRLTRINSKWKEVNIVFLVTKGTMDEKVFSVAVARSGLAGASATHSIEDFSKSERGKMIAHLTEYAHKEAMNRASESGLLSLTEALVA